MSITDHQAELATEIILDYTTWLTQHKTECKGMTLTQSIDKYVETYKGVTND